MNAGLVLLAVYAAIAWTTGFLVTWPRFSRRALKWISDDPPVGAEHIYAGFVGLVAALLWPLGGVVWLVTHPFKTYLFGKGD